MTYEEIVKKVTAAAKKAKVDKNITVAYQVDIIEEGHGAFYIKVENGTVDVEPYEYYDNDAKIIATAEQIIDLTKGKVGPIDLYHTGNDETVKLLSLVFPAKAKKTPTTKETAAKKTTTKKTAEKIAEVKTTAKKTATAKATEAKKTATKAATKAKTVAAETKTKAATKTKSTATKAKATAAETKTKATAKATETKAKATAKATEVKAKATTKAVAVKEKAATKAKTVKKNMSVEEAAAAIVAVGKNPAKKTK